MYNLIEYSSNYSERAEGFNFTTTNFNVDISNNKNFKSFEYKVDLLRDTEAGGNDEILKNVTTAVPLKYLNNIWRSLQMPLINWKIELKLKWKKYCVLSAAGADNNDAYSDNIIFTIKDRKL